MGSLWSDLSNFIHQQASVLKWEDFHQQSQRSLLLDLSSEGEKESSRGSQSPPSSFGESVIEEMENSFYSSLNNSIQEDFELVEEHGKTFPLYKKEATMTHGSLFLELLMKAPFQFISKSVQANPQNFTPVHGFRIRSKPNVVFGYVHTTTTTTDSNSLVIVRLEAVLYDCHLYMRRDEGLLQGNCGALELLLQDEESLSSDDIESMSSSLKSTEQCVPQSENIEEELNNTLDDFSYSSLNHDPSKSYQRTNTSFPIDVLESTPRHKSTKVILQNSPPISIKDIPYVNNDYFNEGLPMEIQFCLDDIPPSGPTNKAPHQARIQCRLCNAFSYIKRDMKCHYLDHYEIEISRNYCPVRTDEALSRCRICFEVVDKYYGHRHLGLDHDVIRLYVPKEVYDSVFI